MVQVDVFWSFAIGAGFAAAAHIPHHRMRGQLPESIDNQIGFQCASLSQPGLSCPFRAWFAVLS